MRRQRQPSLETMASSSQMSSFPPDRRSVMSTARVGTLPEEPKWYKRPKVVFLSLLPLIVASVLIAVVLMFSYSNWQAAKQFEEDIGKLRENKELLQLLHRELSKACLFLEHGEPEENWIELQATVDRKIGGKFEIQLRSARASSDCVDATKIYIKIAEEIAKNANLRLEASSKVWTAIANAQLSVMAENVQGELETLTGRETSSIEYWGMERFSSQLKQLTPDYKTAVKAARNALETEEGNLINRQYLVSFALLLLLILYITYLVLYLYNARRTRKILIHEHERQKRKKEEERKEKQKELLYDVLPPAIAEQLVLGIEVPPETFNSVTVFASDIVGFTILSSKSTPMQVVELLNKFFTRFDTLLAQHDCFKAETIGDAYIVASGLPVPNESLHSNEICTLALDVLQMCDSFQIPHMKNETVMLRVGINTGPIVAGVVGLKRPKFSMFGHTLNVAVHMESTGSAMRIQITNTTVSHLNKHHKRLFQLKIRGRTEVVATGTITTYWLLGRKDHPYVVDLKEADLKYRNAKYYKLDNPLERLLGDLKND